VILVISLLVRNHENAISLYRDLKELQVPDSENCSPYTKNSFLTQIPFSEPLGVLGGFLSHQHEGPRVEGGPEVGVNV